MSLGACPKDSPFLIRVNEVERFALLSKWSLAGNKMTALCPIWEPPSVVLHTHRWCDLYPLKVCCEGHCILSSTSTDITPSPFLPLVMACRIIVPLPTSLVMSFVRNLHLSLPPCAVICKVHILPLSCKLYPPTSNQWS